MSKEGYLRKNHAGTKYSAKNVKRWFQTVGFTVTYYKENDKKSLKGHFDLRNVLGIHPVHDAEDKQSAGEEAIMLKISEDGKSSPKVMIISFKGDPLRERGAWLRLWCSAIEARYVHSSLAEFVDPALVDALNAAYAETQAISSQRSRFRKSVATTKVLTPRSSVIAAPGDMVLDTPRDTPRGASPRAAPVDPPEGSPPTNSTLPPDEAPAPSEAPLGELGPESAPPAMDTTFEITVPENVKPGDKLQATTPDGVKVR